jgi:hypothetical protein
MHVLAIITKYNSLARKLLNVIFIQLPDIKYIYYNIFIYNSFCMHVNHSEVFQHR